MYAKEGKLATGRDDLDVLERALFSRSNDPAEAVPANPYTYPLVTPIAVVLHAARARARLAAGEPVKCLQLAALASYSPSRITGLAGKQLRRDLAHQHPGRAMDAPLLAEDVLPWLAAHGVAGFSDEHPATT